MVTRRKYYRKWHRPFKRVLSDAQVFGALELRGYKPPYDFMLIAEKILPEAFGYKFISYTRMRSAFGNEFGRWEIG